MELTRDEIRNARDIAFEKLSVQESIAIYDMAFELEQRVAGLNIKDAVRVLAAIGEKVVESER